MTIQEMRTKIDEISRDIAELRACQLKSASTTGRLNVSGKSW